MKSVKSLILLHGALGSQRDLAVLRSLLGDHYRLYTFDFIGHGQNQAGHAFSIPALVKQLRQFILDEELDQPHLFGYSMGGYVALSLALKEPQLICSITTLGTKFDWSEESVAQEVGKLNPEIIGQKVPAFAKALALQHGESTWKQVLYSTAQMMKELSKAPPLTEDTLPGIKLPVQILLGDQDKMVTVEEARAMHEALPNSRFEFLADTEHPLQKADLDGLAERLIRFHS